MKANAHPIFDTLLSSVAVEDVPGIDDPEQATQALLASMYPGKYAPPRITTPIYEPPELKAEYEKSAPFPLEYKADVNQRKGEITAYLTVWNDPATGKPYVDGYKDIVHAGAFDQTVQELEQIRKHKNTEYLVPDLWQHERHEQLGGIRAIYSDSKGVIYVAQLVKSITRARYALDLAERKMIGSSFGYDATLFDYTGDIRNLRAVRLHEISQVTFPANPYAEVLDVKSRFYVPSNYPGKPAAQKTDWQKVRTDMRKADELFHQLIGQGIQAHQQYKYDLEGNRPRIIPGKGSI